MIEYENEINNLIKKCEDFTNCLHIFSHNFFDFSKRNNTGCFIDYIDSSATVLQKEQFLRHIVSSITDYVYSDAQQKRRLDSINASESHKHNTILYDAKQTFRRPRHIIPNSIPSNQFDSELSSKLDVNEKSKFDSLYSISSNNKSYKLNNYSLDSAKELISIFEKYKFDYKQVIIQGQFSELMLYNILINVYDAVPLVHKMSITTNPQIERHGIDAIHVAIGSSNLELYIGESKAYARKQGSFKAAVEDALHDVIVHRDNLTSELNLYAFSDNISEGLENFLTEFLKGKHKTTNINLICMISYDNHNINTHKDRDDFILKTKQMIIDDCKNISANDFNIDNIILEKVIFILFPINQMNELMLQYTAPLT